MAQGHCHPGGPPFLLGGVPIINPLRYPSDGKCQSCGSLLASLNPLTVCCACQHDRGVRGERREPIGGRSK